jgi:hypothetical protein
MAGKGLLPYSSTIGIARLSAAHLLAPHPRRPERWLPQAARYLAEARAALRALG